MKMLSIQAFLGLLKRIRSRRPSSPYRRAEPEADVYNLLMDDLEDKDEEEVVEGSRQWWAKVYVVGEVVLFLGLAAAVVVTREVGEVNKHTWWRVDMWQWVTLVMVLLTGLWIVRFATFLVLTPVKRRWRVHRYWYIHGRGKWSVDVTFWFGLVLVIWCLWFRTRLILVRWEALRVVVHQTTGLLISLVLGSFLWMLKNMLYLKLKADLHYVQLFDRIQHTVIDFHGIQIIYHEGMWKFLTSHANMIKGTQAHLTNKEAREAKECKGNREKKRGRKREQKGRTSGQTYAE
ncbi:hypothetical protein V2J09_003045 [Rumex salicifolius]